MSISKSDLILMAEIGPAHGIQGEFRLHSHTEPPENVLQYILRDTNGAVILTPTTAREHKGGLIIRAKEITDRTAAEKARGTKLYVLREELPDPEEDEFYITDLIGLEARDASGAVVGKVRGVDNFGAGDLLDVKPADGASFYVPFTQAHVPEVKLTEGFIIVDPEGL